MCEPTTIMALSAAGAVAGAAGAVQQGQQAQAWNNYNAQVALNNADYARQIAKTKEESLRPQQKYKRQKMAGMFMKNGVVINDNESAGLVMESQFIEDEFEALMVRHGGEADATKFQNQATLDRAKGAAASSNSYMQAGGQLLTGAGTVASQGYQMKVWGQ